MPPRPFLPSTPLVTPCAGVVVAISGNEPLRPCRDSALTGDIYCSRHVKQRKRQDTLRTVLVKDWAAILDGDAPIPSSRVSTDVARFTPPLPEAPVHAEPSVPTCVHGHVGSCPVCQLAGRTLLAPPAAPPSPAVPVILDSTPKRYAEPASFRPASSVKLEKPQGAGAPDGSPAAPNPTSPVEPVQPPHDRPVDPKGRVSEARAQLDAFFRVT